MYFRRAATWNEDWPGSCEMKHDIGHTRKERIKMKSIKRNRQVMFHLTVGAVVTMLLGGFCGCGNNSDEVASTHDVEVECGEDLIMFAKCGEILYNSINQANIVRLAAGLETLWPKSREHLSDDKEDISGRLYNNSASYFFVLFDLANSRKSNWSPYIDCDSKWAIGKVASLPQRTPVALWSVAIDIDDSVADDAPILISSNFDCAKLPKVWDGIGNNDVIPIATHPLVGNQGIIVVKRNGKILKLPYSQVTLRNILGKDSFSLPKQYLTPNGVVNIGR